ncbi:MAG: hypothetical protein P8Y71_23505 [Pseudolabrys sp.]|jgi:hypothetical protein
MYKADNLMGEIMVDAKEAALEWLIAIGCLAWGGYELASINGILVAVGLFALTRAAVVELKAITSAENSN